MPHDPDDAFNDVVDVGEVAFHLAVVEQGNRLAGQNGPAEQERGHVGTTPGPVDRKTQAGRRIPYR